MKGNMKVWKAVATWLWWTAIVGPAWVCALTGLRRNTVSFTTVNATKESYTGFMEALRDQLASGDETHAIPVLREPSTVPDSQRFLLVELSDREGASVTLALDVINAYVVAYQAGNQSYFFKDAPELAFSNLFPDTQRQRLPFGSSYPELERVAEPREKIGLGILSLEQAISSLRKTSSSDHKQEIQARSIKVFIQMVSEAARFKPIEQQVRQSIIASGDYRTFRPNASMLSLENNWGALSTAIQESNQGVFRREVRLQGPDYSWFNVDSVTLRIISNLALVKFVCSNQASSQFSPLIYMV